MKRLFDEDESEIVDAIDGSPDGLGDSLASALEKIGADKAAKLFEKITGASCGCDQRRAWLNKFWPYTKSHKEIADAK
ncbi:MAG: hypothetical protein H7Z14_06535 [Anaerolineae bacterium]|nr:hypothetical protein [Phycisphaerae bacterium]